MQSSIRDDDRMSELACKSIMTIDQLAVCYNTASHSSTERDHDKISHAFGSTIHHFANSCSICIVGKRDRELEFILDHLGKGNDTFPGKIGSIFNGAGIIISIRRTYTN